MSTASYYISRRFPAPSFVVPPTPDTIAKSFPAEERAPSQRTSFFLGLFQTGPPYDDATRSRRPGTRFTSRSMRRSSVRVSNAGSIKTMSTSFSAGDPRSETKSILFALNRRSSSRKQHLPVGYIPLASPVLPVTASSAFRRHLCSPAQQNPVKGTVRIEINGLAPHIALLVLQPHKRYAPSVFLPSFPSI